MQIPHIKNDIDNQNFFPLIATDEAFCRERTYIKTMLPDMDLVMESISGRGLFISPSCPFFRN